jgi:cobalamin synthase
MAKFFKNPFFWVVLAFICYLLSIMLFTTWASILLAIVGVGLALFAFQLLSNLRKDDKGNKRKKITSLEKAGYASVVVVIALCVSTNLSLLAPVCWLVVAATGVWYLNEYLEDHAHESTKRR